MTINRQFNKKPFFSFLILCIFFIENICPCNALAQIMAPMPQAGEMVLPSPATIPVSLRGIKIFPENPFRFDFIIDKGQNALDKTNLTQEANRLIRYFLTTLTIPQKDLWVNLSPEESDRIIPNAFGLTEMGQELLAQDYLLKQLSASLLYPEEEAGAQFWETVYQKASQTYGITDIPVNLMNKVWILPEKAVVYEHEDRAFVVESHLKVVTAQEYDCRNKKEGPIEKENGTEPLSSDLLSEIILPVIEKEINEGEQFILLRQIYQSMILATWYKRKLKAYAEFIPQGQNEHRPFLYENYVSKNKTAGVNGENPQEKEKIYQQYLDAFQKGVYAYVKEDYDSVTQQVVPRKYFSGGMNVMEVDAAMSVVKDTSFIERLLKSLAGSLFVAGIVFGMVDPSGAQVAAPETLMVSTPTGAESGSLQSGYWKDVTVWYFDQERDRYVNEAIRRRSILTQIQDQLINTGVLQKGDNDRKLYEIPSDVLRTQILKIFPDISIVWDRQTKRIQKIFIHSKDTGRELEVQGYDEAIEKLKQLIAGSQMDKALAFFLENLPNGSPGASANITFSDILENDPQLLLSLMDYDFEAIANLFYLPITMKSIGRNLFLLCSFDMEKGIQMLQLVDKEKGLDNLMASIRFAYEYSSKNESDIFTVFEGITKAFGKDTVISSLKNEIVDLEEEYQENFWERYDNIVKLAEDQAGIKNALRSYSELLKEQYLSNRRRTLFATLTNGEPLDFEDLDSGKEKTELTIASEMLMDQVNKDGAFEAGKSFYLDFNLCGNSLLLKNATTLMKKFTEGTIYENEDPQEVYKKILEGELTKEDFDIREDAPESQSEDYAMITELPRAIVSAMLIAGMTLGQITNVAAEQRAIDRKGGISLLERQIPPGGLGSYLGQAKVLYFNEKQGRFVYDPLISMNQMLAAKKFLEEKSILVPGKDDFFLREMDVTFILETLRKIFPHNTSFTFKGKEKKQLGDIYIVSSTPRSSPDANNDPILQELKSLLQQDINQAYQFLKDLLLDETISFEEIIRFHMDIFYDMIDLLGFDTIAEMLLNPVYAQPQQQHMLRLFQKDSHLGFQVLDFAIQNDKEYILDKYISDLQKQYKSNADPERIVFSDEDVLLQLKEIKEYYSDKDIAEKMQVNHYRMDSHFMNKMQELSDGKNDTEEKKFFDDYISILKTTHQISHQISLYESVTGVGPQRPDMEETIDQSYELSLKMTHIVENSQGREAFEYAKKLYDLNDPYHEHLMITAIENAAEGTTYEGWDPQELMNQISSGELTYKDFYPEDTSSKEDGNLPNDEEDMALSVQKKADQEILKPAEVGGIDLNMDNLDIELRGNGIIPFHRESVDKTSVVPFEGLVPMVIQISPMENGLMYLTN